MSKCWYIPCNEKNYELLATVLKGISVTKKPDWIDTNSGIIAFYISRAFITFGIYQMVAAFRKFGKGD